MKKSIIFLAAIAAFFSCAKDNSVNNTTAEKTFSVTLTASAPTSEDAPSPASADTKTTLVDGNNKKFVHWSPGDAIKVLFFPNRTNSNIITGPSGVLTSKLDVASGEATFSTNSWSWAGIPHDIVYNDQRKSRLAATGVAVYPYTATAVSNKPTSSTGAELNSEISFVLPEAQNAVLGNIESELNFSYADVNRDSFISTIDNGTETKLRFKNACALIELTMPSEMPKVTSISISSNDKVALTGKGSLKLNYYQDVVEGGITVTEGAGVVLNSSTEFEAGKTYYAVVWPGTHTSGLTIEFTAEDGTVATKTTPAVTLNAAKIKPYTFNKGLEFIAPVQEEFDYIYADGSTGNEVNSNIVGVVIFRGNPKEKFNDTDLPDQYCNGLAISLKPTSVYFHKSDINVSDSDLVLSSKPTKNYNIGGYTVMNKWKSVANLVLYTSNYGTLSSNNSGWYHGTPKEWDYIFNNLSPINEKITAAGGDAINLSTSNTYLLPLIKNTQIVWKVGYSYGYYAKDEYWQFNSNYYMHNARPIFAF